MSQRNAPANYGNALPLALETYAYMYVCIHKQQQTRSNMTAATHEQANRHPPIHCSNASAYGINRLRKELFLSLQGEREDMERGNDLTAAAASETKVFGSPPEPMFNDTRHGIKSDLLHQTLQSLDTINSEAVASYAADRDSVDSFRTGTAVAFIFGLCRHYGLPADVRYRSVDMFHRFMTKHIVELYQHVLSTQNQDSPISWTAVESRLKHQISLRALTCVQLSSKMSLHYKIVGVSKAKAFMTQCGFRYAASSLVQSEIRVLKTLDFCISGPTPLDYVELLTEIVGKTSAVPVKQLHGVALKVLDIFYYHRGDIVKRLNTMTQSNASVKVALQGDNMLLAASVIGAAAFVLSQASSDYIVDLLTTTVPSLPREDILDISALLIEQVMSD